MIDGDGVCRPGVCSLAYSFVYKIEEKMNYCVTDITVHQSEHYTEYAILSPNS